MCFSCDGNFNHKWGERIRNQISGPERAELKKALKYRKGAAVAVELNAKMNKDHVRCGNANSKYTAKLLTQIRHEVYCHHLCCIVNVLAGQR